MAMLKRKPAPTNAGEVRTLYEYLYARVHGTLIYCYKGHPIATQTGKKSLQTNLLARGRRLAMAYCQRCPDFQSMGPPIPDEEKGWIPRVESGGADEK
jgi:hypothetical protein